MCLAEFCGSSDYCNKCINNPNQKGDKGMTKEELKQEAKERADEYTNLRPFHIGYEEGYFDGAEPREKQIQIDAEQIRVLQKQNGELTDKVEHLTKAKNLLKRWLRLYNTNTIKGIIADTEQFLKEE